MKAILTVIFIFFTTSDIFHYRSVANSYLQITYS